MVAWAVCLPVLAVGCAGGATRPSTSAASGSRTTAAGPGTLVYVVAHGNRTAVGEMAPDGTGAHLLPMAGPLCCYAPQLSPDGTQLVTAGEGAVLVSASDGTGQKAIWASPVASVGSPHWSPDGKLIAFGVTTSNWNSPGPPPSQLMVVSPDGSGLRQVATGSNIRDIAWAPDGLRIAFLQNQGDVWVVPLTGGAVTTLYGSGTNLPNGLSWAPGSALLFGQGSPYGVYSYHPGQASATSLLPGAILPSWAPNARHFAALESGRIVIASADGTDPTTIGPSGVQSVSWGETAQRSGLSPGPLHTVSFDITAVTLIPATVTTASVQDSDRSANANQLTATIDWGDGTTPSSGTVSVDNDSPRCTCGISGSHTYLHEGEYTVTTTVTKMGRDGEVVQTTRARATAHVAWALLHPVQSDRVVRGVEWPGAQAVLTWASLTGSPPGAKATIDWGDASAATTMAIPAPSFFTAIGGLARGYDDVSLDAGHTYQASGSFRLTVTVSAPGHAAFSAHEYARVEPSTPTFTVSPSVPHAGIPGSPAQPAMLSADPQSPTGAPVTEWDWDFGDGTTFVDTPAKEAAWYALLRSGNSRSPDAAFFGAALRLGIDITLGGHVDPGFGVAMWSALGDHMVPHVFAIPQGYRASLTEKTSRGTATGTKYIATQTTCKLWADGLFGQYTVCDTARGWQAATASPNRWPDYYTFLVNLGGSREGLVGSATFGLTVTSSGELFVSYGASGGIGLSLPGSGATQVAFGMGFVEAPDGPKPGASLINHYVDGWTVNAAYTATLGPLGGSEAIVWSPTDGLGGEEYYLDVQRSFSLSVTAGSSCSMDVGNVSRPDLRAFASLVPGAYGPWPWQPGVPVPTLTARLIGQALNLTPAVAALEVCGVLPSGPPS